MVKEEVFPNSKRKFRRVDLELRADSQILLPDAEPEWFYPNIKTLGGGGLTFDFPAPFPVGTELKMRVYYYTDEIDLTGKIVWTNRIGEMRVCVFKSGLEFTKISEQNLARINHIIDIHLGNPEKSS